VSPLFDVRVGTLRLVITGRRGGHSEQPYAGLNLSLDVGDDDQRVLSNRALVAGSIGMAPASLVFMRQVHGDRVLAADEVAVLVSGEAAAAEADAAVLATPGAGVAVTAADCLPLLLADRGGELGAAAHIGRRGLALGLGPAVLRHLAASGARDPVAVLGPAIGACCYEVSADLRDEVDALAPGAAATTSVGTPAVDIRRALRRQLTAAGLPPSAIADVERCTAEDEEMFSYRRDPVTGRFAGIVAITGHRAPP